MIKIASSHSLIYNLTASILLKMLFFIINIIVLHILIFYVMFHLKQYPSYKIIISHLRKLLGVSFHIEKASHAFIMFDLCNQSL